jgi:hypothetical protein
MTQIVIVCYRPKEGKKETLLELARDHVPVLRKEQLATEREAIIMQTKEGIIVEVFEWVSAEAISAAHKNAAVLAMWQRFAEACEYVSPNTMPEFQHIFSSFDAID